jgi:hypothetical protein
MGGEMKIRKPFSNPAIVREYVFGMQQTIPRFNTQVAEISNPGKGTTFSTFRLLAQAF